MNQQNYLAAIQKQQSLIRKLFVNRKRRSEVIDELTKERYDHLRGKFFKAPRDDKRFRAVPEGTTLYICCVYADSNYIMSDEAYVVIQCRYVSENYHLDDDKKIIRGFESYTTSFRFNPEDNIDEIIAPLLELKEKAVEELNGLYKNFVANYLKKG